MYTPVEKTNQLILGEGNVVVVTGWTPKETIARFLKPNKYAAIGQLYNSTRGLSPLIRNLLANPQVNHIVAIALTKEDENTKSCECLKDFFLFGIKDLIDNKHIVNSQYAGCVDAEIPISALEQLRETINFKLFKNKPEAINYIGSIENTNTLTKKKLFFPFPKPPISDVLPSSVFGHKIEAKTIADGWIKILHRVRTNGIIRPTGYDGSWQELIDLVAVITEENGAFPEPNYLPVTPNAIKTYIPQILNDARYIEGVKYTYGQRLRSWFGVDQVEQVISKLIKEIDAASAVMSLWDVKDHDKGGSPCLNHIWVRVIENKLTMTATFRSNDMFGAWVSNAMGLRALQQHIADAIASRSSHQISIGELITISQSAHIYEDCWGYADDIIKKYYGHQKSDYDVIGNFIITRQEEDINVEQVDSQSKTVAVYRDHSPDKLISAIIKNNPTICPHHAAYLGREIFKASTCMNYQQGK